MRHFVFAIVVAAIVGLAMWLETTPRGAVVAAGPSEWLAACALQEKTETITAVELPAASGGIKALDAALVLRAILRFQPRALVFIDPIESGEAEALLISKLNDAKIPVVFTASEPLASMSRVTITPQLPQIKPMTTLVPAGRSAGATMTSPGLDILIAARQGDHAVASNVWQFCLTLQAVLPADVTGKIPGELCAGSLSVPVDATGGAKINPLAARFVNTIAFDQLMLRTERSEQGSISADLETLFKGRLVAVQYAGENRAEGFAGVWNRLTEKSPPSDANWIALAIAVTLPWWRTGRFHRALIALMVTCGWLLMALAIYQEFRIAVPLTIVGLLPLLALIPPDAGGKSDEVEQRKLPA